MSNANWKTTASLVFILLLSFVIRGLTSYFINTHLTDPAWFQSGTYTLFDRQAQNILDNKASLFWIDDPSRTDAAIYPPGYSMWLALIYKATGSRSAATVQKVQFVIDSFAVLLVVGIAFSVYGYRVGLIAGTLASLSPLLALYGSTPLADAPTSWVVLTSVWLLVGAAKREGTTFFPNARDNDQKVVTSQHTRTSIIIAVSAGALLGLSCWFRSNALLLPIFWIAAISFLRTSKFNRLLMSTAIVVGFMAVISPLIVRNAAAFHVFTPTGLGVGTNLWEGIGETDRAAEFGAVYGDANLVERERVELGISSDQRFDLYCPDGVRRDRARARKAFTVIISHPVWYATVMLRRIAGVLKFAGKPDPVYGSSGINVTSEKCLPERMRGGIARFLVEPVGMVQSLIRHLALPLVFIGLVIAMRFHSRMTILLLSTILYYLVVGSTMHTEFRYGLPMQALLFVFAGVSIDWLIAQLENLLSKRQTK